MVFNQTQNTSIKNNLIDELKLNPSVDNIPNVVSPTIQPVFEVNRKVCDIVKSAGATSTGSTTLYTTPSDKDFYLCSAQLSYMADATADNTTIVLNGSPASIPTAVNLIRFQKLTTTASNQTQSITYAIPLKMARNTTIQISSTFTVGACGYAGTITGYTLDTAIKTV